MLSRQRTSASRGLSRCLAVDDEHRMFGQSRQGSWASASRLEEHMFRCQQVRDGRQVAMRLEKDAVEIPYTFLDDEEVDLVRHDGVVACPLESDHETVRQHVADAHDHGKRVVRVTDRGDHDRREVMLRELDSDTQERLKELGYLSATYNE